MKVRAGRTSLNPVPERAAAVYAAPTTREGTGSKATDITGVSAVVRDEDSRIPLIATAKALGLTIPPSLLLRADQVLE